MGSLFDRIHYISSFSYIETTLVFGTSQINLIWNIPSCLQKKYLSGEWWRQPAEPVCQTWR